MILSTSDFFLLLPPSFLPVLEVMSKIYNNLGDRVTQHLPTMPRLPFSLLKHFESLFCAVDGPGKMEKEAAIGGDNSRCTRYMDKVQRFIFELTNGEAYGSRHTVYTDDGYTTIIYQLHLSSKKQQKDQADYQIVQAVQFENKTDTATHASTKANTVLFIHGLLESSLNWVLNGNHSLPIILLRLGWDVWLGNNRGSSYAIFTDEAFVDKASITTECNSEVESSLVPSERFGENDDKLDSTKTGKVITDLMDNICEDDEIEREVIRATQVATERFADRYNMTERNEAVCGTPGTLTECSNAFESRGVSANLFELSLKSLFKVLMLLCAPLLFFLYLMRLARNTIKAAYRCAMIAVVATREALEACIHPSKDPEDWSFEEMGTFDIPAMLSHIKRTNPSCRIICIGQSQGAAQLLVAASLHKIRNVEALCLFNPPVVLKTFDNLPNLLSNLMEWGLHHIDAFINIVKYCRVICPGPIFPSVCEVVASRGLDFFRSKIDRATVFNIFRNTPDGKTSRKNCKHWLQLIKSNAPLHRFANGPCEAPVMYPLWDIEVPVYVYFAENDNIVNVEASIQYLEKSIKLSSCSITKWPHWSHVDFGWGSESYIEFFPHVVNSISKYAKVD